MIHVQGGLKNNHSTFTQDVFLFLKLYINSAGSTENEAIIYLDQSMTTQIGAMRLPNYTATELQGGTGTNEYEKLLDSLHDLAIELLETDNPNSVFTKVNPIEPETETETEI